MTTLIVQYRIADGTRPQVETAVGELMAAVGEAAPPGVRYAIGTLPDGVTVVGVLELADGVENPLPTLPAARAFQQDLARWIVGEPPVPVDVLGAYAPAR